MILCFRFQLWHDFDILNHKIIVLFMPEKKENPWIADILQLLYSCVSFWLLVHESHQISAPNGLVRRDFSVVPDSVFLFSENIQKNIGRFPNFFGPSYMKRL